MARAKKKPPVVITTDTLRDFAYQILNRTVTSPEHRILDDIFVVKVQGYVKDTIHDDFLSAKEDTAEGVTVNVIRKLTIRSMTAYTSVSASMGDEPDEIVLEFSHYNGYSWASSVECVLPLRTDITKALNAFYTEVAETLVSIQDQTA